MKDAIDPRKKYPVQFYKIQNGVMRKEDKLLFLTQEELYKKLKELYDSKTIFEYEEI